MVVTGAYLWLVTTLPVLTTLSGTTWLRPGVPALAALLSVLALPALLVGAWLRASQPGLALALGMGAFLACLVGSWLLTPEVIDPLQLASSWRGLLGSLGFVMFALSWGERPSHSLPHESTNGSSRAWRDWLQSLPLVLAITVSIALESVAWEVHGKDRSIFAHLIAILFSMALVSKAVTLDGVSSRPLSPRPARRLWRAAQPLVALLLILVAIRTLWRILQR